MPLSPVYQQGNILLSYRDELYSQNITNKQNTLSVGSLAFLYTGTKNKKFFIYIDNSWPYIRMEICSCSIDILISLMYMNIHTWVKHFALYDIRPDEAVIEIDVCYDASNYQIDMQQVRVSNTEQNTIKGRALRVLYSAGELNCSTSSIWSIGKISVTELRVFKYFGVVIVAQHIQTLIKHSMVYVLLKQCRLPDLEIHDFINPIIDTMTYSILITNTTFDNKHNICKLLWEKLDVCIWSESFTNCKLQISP